jgi:hypothetical protein
MAKNENESYWSRRQSPSINKKELCEYVVKEPEDRISFHPQIFFKKNNDFTLPVFYWIVFSDRILFLVQPVYLKFDIFVVYLHYDI